ncbi:MAG: ATP-binding protein, partial [Actinomycetota bacterium]
MERLDEALSVLQLLGFGVPAIGALLLWRRTGGRPAGLLAATFGVVALTVLGGQLLPEDPDAPALVWAGKLLIAPVILFPYLLYRFTLCFESRRGWFARAAAVLSAVAVAATLLMPPLPGPGEPQPPLVGVYVAGVVSLWLALSAAAARVLWRAGAGEVTVVRRRMRTMAFGALAFAAAVVIAGLTQGRGDVSGWDLAVQLLAVGTGPLFFLGFATPRFLRTAWRRNEESAFRESEVHLIQASDPGDVAQILLPAAARLIGARASVLVAGDGPVIGAHGVDAAAAQELAASPTRLVDGAGVEPGPGTSVSLPLRSGSLVVELSPFSPFFGGDEANLLHRVGALVDIALERADADREIRRLNAELHERIRELEESNEELGMARQDADTANRAKSEFLSRMSHELRTPLNAILGFGQLLSIDATTDHQQESVAHILKGGKHLLDLINEILDISRIEEGRLSLSLENVDVGEVVGEVIDLMIPLAARGRVTIDGSGSPPLSSAALADRQRLKQVLLNLVGNAVKYNRPGGAVRLTTGPTPEGRVRVAVADTGHGIAPEDLGRLFSPFERIGAERTEVEGTGLGLVLAKRLVEAMGGTVGVESRVGEGSTFWVDLAPAESPTDQVPEHPATNPAPADPVGREADAGHPRSPTCKLLYVEDNLANLALVEQILHRRPGIELIVAMQGGLAVELARVHHPDLALLDLHLPDMHGAQVLEAFRT